MQLYYRIYLMFFLSQYFFSRVIFLSGMHRKSLEAAEALKNDESGNSDRDDAASKTSDISISGGNSKLHNMQTNNSMSSCMPKATSVDTVSCHSITPTSSSGSGSSVPTSSGMDGATTTITTASTPPSSGNGVGGGGGGGGSHTPPLSLSQHHHHQHLLDQKSKEINLVSSPPHLSYHPDNDPEAFRWVDYNRDPISFIR